MMSYIGLRVTSSSEYVAKQNKAHQPEDVRIQRLFTKSKFPGRATEFYVLK